MEAPLTGPIRTSRRSRSSAYHCFIFFSESQSPLWRTHFGQATLGLRPITWKFGRSESGRGSGQPACHLQSAREAQPSFLPRNGFEERLLPFQLRDDLENLFARLVLPRHHQFPKT